MKHKTELALPAGSLQCALHAFKGGADAVYLGLKSFSARKGAVNFSFEDLRKLKAYCQENDKKFYIALNTLVKDQDLPEVIQLLKQIDYVKPDGIIVQDLGIASIIKKDFPNLELHGSTQLAVHTINGVKQLQSLGFTRVVLSRELSFEEIKTIRQACPDVQLKVFIHGALCYGFSGLCMASQVITGRSANCGACAQICRTWFTCKETQTDGWYFSMKDLNLGEKVLEYEKIGIDSLKVEGRMKGPDYTYWCAKYYSLLLEGHSPNDQEVKWAKEAMQVSFSRETTEGFFEQGTSCNCTNMVCSTDPTHRGIQIGTIDKVLNGKAVVRFTKPAALRDGLKVVSSKAVSFSLSHIDGGKSFISEGETATINFPSSEFEKKPGFGTPVYCISRHNLNPSQINENITLFKKPLDLEINLTQTSITINGNQYPIEVQQAQKESDLNQIFTKVFEASDKSYFTLGKLKITNNTGFNDVFIPMSVLKQIRRSFYEQQDQEFENLLSNNSLDITKPETEKLPKRSLLGLWDKEYQDKDNIYLSLSPVMFNEKQYLKQLEDNLKPNMILGLNNIAQVLWAKQHPELKVFADIFLYTQNSVAYNALKEELPSLIGSYELDSDTQFTFTGDDYTPPLFISRVCFRHNGLNLSCKLCSKNNTFTLEQNKNEYNVICKDCITIVTKRSNK